MIERFVGLVTDSNPEREWRLIHFERASFGIPNAIGRRVESIVELLRARDGDPAARPSLVKQVNQLLREAGLCFKFTDGETSNLLYVNRSVAKDRLRKPVQFRLNQEHGSRGLATSYVLVPRVSATLEESRLEEVRKG